MTGFGAGDSRGRGGFLYNAAFHLLVGRIYDDKDVQERIVRRSKLDWVIARPVILTNGPKTSAYRALVDPRDWTCGFISRADVADFLVKQIDDDAFRHKTPVLTSSTRTSWRSPLLQQVCAALTWEVPRKDMQTVCSFSQPSRPGPLLGDSFIECRIDHEQASILDGGSADLGKLNVAVQSLIALLPGRELPAPESQREDPRVKMFEIYMEMRRRGEIGLKALPEGGADARIAELTHENRAAPGPACLIRSARCADVRHRAAGGTRHRMLRRHSARS